jgi:hypothetical protein
MSSDLLMTGEQWFHIFKSELPQPKHINETTAIVEYKRVIEAARRVCGLKQSTDPETPPKTLSLQESAPDPDTEPTR